MAPRKKLPKARVDALLVQRGLAASQDEAARLLLAGLVSGQGRRYEKPGELIPQDAELNLRRPPHPFVGRGGAKLAGALDALGLDVTGRWCLDLGASTGGFTDCLLQRGAAHVHAFDVGRGQLHERLLRDPRVTARDRLHVLELAPTDFPPRISLIVADLSFISLARVLPHLAAIAPVGCAFLLLVKPQFELPSEQVPEGGVVRDATLRRSAVEGVLAAAESQGLEPWGLAPSLVEGAQGNREYFLAFSKAHGEDTGPLFAPTFPVPFTLDAVDFSR